MKHANILYDVTDIVLTDLDAMCTRNPDRLWRYRCRRDIDRYLRDLDMVNRSLGYHAVLDGKPQVGESGARGVELNR